MDTRCREKYEILEVVGGAFPYKSHDENLSCQASHSAPSFKEKLIQKVSPASHSLIVFFSLSNRFLSSLTVLPLWQIHPKFNYFQRGFHKSNGGPSLPHQVQN